SRTRPREEPAVSRPRGRGPDAPQPSHRPALRGPGEQSETHAWQRLDALLAEALSLPVGEREAWLSRLSAEDEMLASSLRELLSRSATTDSSLHDPVSPAVLAAAGDEVSLEQPGTLFGPYRLLRLLGAGGMGQVWLARRIDGTLDREVALKLPRTEWAPGMAARLQQERDALAALEHPNIARLYDAGVPAEGRPYLAMEYVGGVPIDRHASAARLSLRERLELFLEVAAAVSYAHAHLVVHRTSSRATSWSRSRRASACSTSVHRSSSARKGPATRS